MHASSHAAPARIGLLWFNDTDEPLANIIATAAARFTEKYGHSPIAAYLHPLTLSAKVSDGVTLQLIAAPNIRPNNFWLVGAEGGVQ